MGAVQVLRVAAVAFAAVGAAASASADETIAVVDARAGDALTRTPGRAALIDADEVGFVLGGGTGYGHGVYATGRARITVTAFSVQ